MVPEWLPSDGLPHQCGQDRGNAAARVGDETVNRGLTELNADVDPCAGFAEMVPGTGGLRRRWISKGSFPMIKASAMAPAAALVLLAARAAEAQAVPPAVRRPHRQRRRFTECRFGGEPAPPACRPVLPMPVA
jgi:hypothetical protein